MTLRRAEVGIQANQIIQGGPGGRRIALGKLRLGDPQHEVGIVLVQTGERRAVLGNGFLITAVARQLVRVALTAGDVTSDTGLVLITAQVRLGIHGLFEAARGALGCAATEDVGQDLYKKVGQHSRKGQHRYHQHPDPELVAARLDDVDDEPYLGCDG